MWQTVGHTHSKDTVLTAGAAASSSAESAASARPLCVFDLVLRFFDLVRFRLLAVDGAGASASAESVSAVDDAGASASAASVSRCRFRLDA